MPDGAALPTAPAREARCVVWHERGADLKPELFAALARPGFSVVRCDDEFAAVAHVCRIAREVRGLAQPPLLVLLLVDPPRLRAVVSVVESAARHAPGAAVWMYDLAASPLLRTVRQTDVAAWRRVELSARPENPDTPVIAVTATTPPPIGHPPPSTEPEDSSNPAASIEVPRQSSPPPVSLLTDDELAMLLDSDPPNPERPPGS